MLKPPVSRATPATRRGAAPDPVDGSRPGEVEGSHTVEVVGVRGVVVVDPVVVGTPMRELGVDGRSAGSGL
jgi:hypothetical protein